MRYEIKDIQKLERSQRIEHETAEMVGSLAEKTHNPKLKYLLGKMAKDSATHAEKLKEIETAEPALRTLLPIESDIAGGLKEKLAGIEETLTSYEKMAKREEISSEDRVAFINLKAQKLRQLEAIKAIIQLIKKSQ